MTLINPLLFVLAIFGISLSFRSFRVENTLADTTQIPNRGANPQRVGAIEMPVIGLAITGLLAYTWLQRNEGHISAEDGIGYWLGIAGSVMMLMLLIYPLRKRLPVLKRFGDIRSWFRWHMILGIVGPALVVVHSNFTLGSLNSRVALITMLIVAGSGLIGRFFYARIHSGLYGRRSSAQDQIERLGLLKETMNIPPQARAEIRDILGQYERKRVDPSGSVWLGLLNAITGPFSHQSLRRRVTAKITAAQKANARPSRKQDRRAQRKQATEFKQALSGYFKAVARTEAFYLYERLFALWHLLHLPLFVILVLAAAVHVLAVHLY